MNASGLRTIDSQVKDSVKEGAEILTGGEQKGNKGYLYKPTILKIFLEICVWHKKKSLDQLRPYLLLMTR